MDNVAGIISKHNKRVLSPPNENDAPSCNCRNKDTCPLNGQCRESAIIYKADVKSEGQQNFYYGLCETEFKARYNNHTCSFRNKTIKKSKNPNKKNTGCRLKKHIWELKDAKKDYSISWSIEAKSKPYTCGSKNCALCAKEKLCIALAPRKGLLNKRTEIISSCPHKWKFLLKNI